MSPSSRIITEINDDLKKALIDGDKDKVTTLRGLKSAIQYKEVEAGKQDEGLADDSVIAVLKKEVKSRQESAELYKKGNAEDKAQKELDEITTIEKYLPEAMSEEQIAEIVDEIMSKMGSVEMKQMGQIIGQVKAKAGEAADGGIIARIVKERINQ